MQNNKIFNILSYIPLLFIISLFIPQKNDADVKFHCGQGMLLTILDIVAGVLFSVLGIVLGWIPLIGTIISIISSLVGIVVLILMIIGIINAATDKQAPLPVIGQFAFYR